MSVNEKLKDAEAGDYGSIAPEPENDAVAYVKRHTIALGVLCVLAFGAAVKVDDDLLKGRDKNGVPLDAAAAALPATPPASAFRNGLNGRSTPAARVSKSRAEAKWVTRSPSTATTTTPTSSWTSTTTTGPASGTRSAQT